MPLPPIHLFTLFCRLPYPNFATLRGVITHIKSRNSVLKVTAYEPSGVTHISLDVEVQRKGSDKEDTENYCTAVDVGSQSLPHHVVNCELEKGKVYFLRVSADFPVSGISLCDSFFLQFALQPVEEIPVSILVCIVRTCTRGKWAKKANGVALTVGI